MGTGTELCWDGVWYEHPDFGFFVELNLGHNSRGDMCEMYIMEPIEFDISRLREEYLLAFPGGVEPIDIHVDEQIITYE